MKIEKCSNLCYLEVDDIFWSWVYPTVNLKSLQQFLPSNLKRLFIKIRFLVLDPKILATSTSILRIINIEVFTVQLLDEYGNLWEANPNLYVHLWRSG